MSRHTSIRCRLFGHRWGDWEWWGQWRDMTGYLERRKCAWCECAQHRQVPQ